MSATLELSLLAFQSDLMPDDTLTGAVTWITGLLVGSIGSTVAVLSVAGLGLLMLSGRLPVQRAASVIFGCFVLFSANAIANGLIGALQPAIVVAAAPAIDPPIYTPTVPKPVPYDPYAGASVPNRPGEVIR